GSRKSEESLITLGDMVVDQKTHLPPGRRKSVMRLAGDLHLPAHPSNVQNSVRTVFLLDSPFKKCNHGSLTFGLFSHDLILSGLAFRNSCEADFRLFW